DPKYVDTRDALEKFRAAFPQANVEPIDQWGGVIDITPDNAPIIERVEKIPGLIFAAGMSGHGLSMAPAAGELIAQLILNESQTIVDPRDYRSTRFYTGPRRQALRFRPPFSVTGMMRHPSAGVFSASSPCAE